MHDNEATAKYDDLESAFPAVFHAAEAASAGGQSLYKRTSAVALSLLVVTAICGVIDENAAGWCAALAFVTSGILMGLAIFKNAEVNWYDGRAAAESLKTTAWKFAVCGEPFDRRNATAESEWNDTVKKVATELKSLESPLKLALVNAPDALLKDLRREPREIRAAVYRKRRVKDQRDWYARRARDHSSTVKRFQYGGLALQVVGVLLGAAKGIGIVDVDLLSIAATSVSGLYAWLGVGDYKSVARSYEFAALELDRSLAEMSTVTTESAWATYVADAEAAMSREHTMWATRRRSNS